MRISANVHIDTKNLILPHWYGTETGNSEHIATFPEVPLVDAARIWMPCAANPSAHVQLHNDISETGFPRATLIACCEWSNAPCARSKTNVGHVVGVGCARKLDNR